MSKAEAYVPGERYEIPEFTLPEFLPVLAADGERWIRKSNEARKRMLCCKSWRRKKHHCREVRRYRRRAFYLIRVVDNAGTLQ